MSSSQALSQDLSALERAAELERAPTETERARRETECRFAGVECLGPVIIADGVGGGGGRFPSIQVLQIATLQVDDPAANTWAIAQFPPLPDGGIAGFDICGQIIVETF